VHEQAGASAAVTFDGRDGVLHGTFPSAQVAEKARSSVASVDGVASARLGDDIRIPSSPARRFVVGVEGGELTVAAAVPDRRLRDELLAAAVTASEGALTTDVIVDGKVGVPPVGAFPGIAAALTAVPGNHSVTIEGDSVVVAGVVPDTAALKRLSGQVLAATREVLPEATLDNRLVLEGSPEAGGSSPVGSVSAGGRGSAGGDMASGGTVAEQLAAAVDGEAITFRSGSLVLSTADHALLDRVARVLAASDVTVLVAGHSDARGPLGFNQLLSADRARAVVAYLTERGVPAGRMRAVGFGADEPLQPNDSDEGRAANRRVEIILLP
jgi:outer membrane protein OmpA-like peptidoglycan-associated protein